MQITLSPWNPFEQLTGKFERFWITWTWKVPEFWKVPVVLSHLDLAGLLVRA